MSLNCPISAMFQVKGIQAKFYCYFFTVLKQAAEGIAPCWKPSKEQGVRLCLILSLRSDILIKPLQFSQWVMPLKEGISLLLFMQLSILYKIMRFSYA